MLLHLFALFAASVSSATIDSLGNCQLGDGRHGRCSSRRECEHIHQMKENWSVKNCTDEYSVCCPEPKRKRNIVYQNKREEQYESTAKKWCNYYKNVCPCLKSLDGAGVFVGGIAANPYEIPHMAAIGYGPRDDIVWQCGGSLVSENFVLTAAHCLNDGRYPAAWVSLGTVIVQDKIRDTVNVTLKGQIHPVIERIGHPEYKKPSKYHDIALLKIGSALDNDSLSTLNDKIHPACLQVESEIPPVISSAGWGRLGPFEEPTPILQKGNLFLYNTSECNRTFEVEIKTTDQLQRGIIDSQICAGRIEGGVDTCQGDSGGPLQTTNGSCLDVVVGVTSFGKVCGLKNSLGVYTRVTFYLEWIENIVWKDREACSVDAENYGECLPISKCEHIHEQVRRGYRPVSCGYGQEEPIICCPTPNQVIWVPPFRKSNKRPKSRAPGEAAKQWCDKYKQEFSSSKSSLGNLPKEMNHYPHLANVGYGDLNAINWICAGSLISEKFVIIAAHCLTNIRCQPIKWVRFGSKEFKSDTRWTSTNGTVVGQVHPIIGVAVHPKYRVSTKVNDLALIQIGDSVDADASSTMSAYIHPACLQASVKQIQDAVLVGVNSYDTGDSSGYIISEADVDLSNVTSCSFNSEESMSGKEDFPACKTLCKEFCHVAHQGSLQNLIDEDSQLYEVIGLKKPSYRSTFDGRSLEFTHVFPYLSWIEDHVWPD